MALAGPSVEDKVPLRQLFFVLPVLRFVAVGIFPPVLGTTVPFFCHRRSVTAAIDGIFDRILPSNLLVYIASYFTVKSQTSS